MLLLNYSLNFIALFLFMNTAESQIVECRALKDAITSYTDIVKKIIETATETDFKGVTYNELAKFVDKFGSRLAGSQNLENSIDYMVQLFKDRNITDVYTENVTIPHWVRGKESATLLEPRYKDIKITGLGYSIGTPGIEAEVLVVRSFDELLEKAAQAKGKIVVYNEAFTTYGKTVTYRSKGPSEASRVGAVACLVRSIGPYSIYTTHAGTQTYQNDIIPIPAAAITQEDAEMLQRMQDRGDAIKIRLQMEAHFESDATSRNTIGEIKGSVNPEKVVIISGHIDSWDVGQGAMDDGGGAFISWAALALLKKLNLRPRRTIRTILWTAEEIGLLGAEAYDKAHQHELDNFIFIMESDIGTFEPIGIEYIAGEQGKCILEEIMKLLQPINATGARNSSDVGSDITLWTGRGYPGASLDTRNDRYFWFHHTDGDTMTVEDTASLDKNTALWAAVAYVIADLYVDFPKELPILPKSSHH